MRITVFGSNGLLGSTLVPYLQQCGHEILDYFLDGVRNKRVELTDDRQVKTVLDLMKPEVIINLAALTNVDECEQHPQKAYLSNVRIVENLSKWIKESQNASHLIQISTDHMYDGSILHKENDITLSNYYAFSKYAGELAAASIPSTVLRTNFFGQSQCPGRTSLSDWLIKSLSQSVDIKVFSDVYFSPLSLPTLVRMIENACHVRNKGIFNLGSKNGMSKADFAFFLAETLDLPTGSMVRDTVDKVKLTAYRPKDMRMDSSKFESAFDVQLPTLKEEIQSLIKE